MRKRKKNIRNKGNQSLQRIASRALHASVVLTEIEQTGPLKDGFMKGKKIAAGSGFYVAPDLIADEYPLRCRDNVGFP